jgi:DNA repair exonuclease SbcCD ATPase subunit
MSHEIQQWIAEIKSLQQQLADLERDRNAAHDSAANWRQLYNTEAQQRREETKLSQQTIEALKAELQQIRPSVTAEPIQEPDVAAISDAVSQFTSIEALKAKLIEVTIERDCLANSLKEEKYAHGETREKLTTALGDAVDVIAIFKKRDNMPAKTETAEIEEDLPDDASSHDGEAENVPGLPQTAPIAGLPMARTPSLQLPPFSGPPPRF